MAVSLSTIRSQVRSYLDESTPADWTNAELTTLINQRYHRVYTMVVSVFEDYNITTSFLTTVASQQEYTLPTNVFKLRRVEITYDTSISNSSLRAYPIQSIDAVTGDLANANVGVRFNRSPLYYILGTTTIGFRPVPDKNGTNAIKLWYVKNLSSLSADADTIDLPYPARYWHLIAEGATADALRFGEQNSPEADKFDAKFDRGIVLMQQELEDKVAEDTKYVVDVTGEDVNFS